MKEFQAVKDFIASHDMKALACGRYDIDENNYVKISELDTKQPGELLSKSTISTLTCIILSTATKECL